MDKVQGTTNKDPNLVIMNECTKLRTNKTQMKLRKALKKDANRTKEGSTQKKTEVERNTQRADQLIPKP